jgi:hypothetical protein
VGEEGCGVGEEECGEGGERREVGGGGERRAPARMPSAVASAQSSMQRGRLFACPSNLDPTDIFVR